MFSGPKVSCQYRYWRNSAYENCLLFQRIQVEFPASVWLLTTSVPRASVPSSDTQTFMQAKHTKHICVCVCVFIF